MEDIQTQLGNAAESGNIDALYELIALKPDILKLMDDMEFLHSPMHVAAFHNQIPFAMEVAMLKPSLARKLNTEGYTPMHVALRRGNVEFVCSLLTVDSELVRVKGRNGFTLLHYAAQLNESELVAGLLDCCPKFIEDLTSQCQTAAHIAVKNNSLRTCRVLMKWLKLSGVGREEILQWKDAGGNTILHVAALENKPEAMELFIRWVEVNAKNLEGKTALDLIILTSQDRAITRNGYQRVREILGRARAKQGSEVREVDISATIVGGSRFFSSDDEGLTNEIRSIMLVVAALIANATYQAVLNPPGGYWQDDSSTVVTNLSPAPAPAAPLEHVAGQMIISGPIQTLFMAANTTTFSLSVSLISIFTAGLPYFWIVNITISALIFTYTTALYRIGSRSGQGDDISKPLLVGAFFVATIYFSLTLRILEIYRRKKVCQSLRRLYTTHAK